MKLKFVLVPLVVLGFAVGSYADCSKDEILKLIDKGFTKTEINGICEKSEKKTSLKWITPSRKTCVSYGGKIEDGLCRAQWLIAKDICSASSGRLPSLYELKKVVIDCGGIVGDYNNNEKDSVYQDCYKKQGFRTSYNYWSSTTDASYPSDAWYICFGDAFTNNYAKSTNFSVRCVRVGQ